MDNTYIRILYELSLVIKLDTDERKVISDFCVKCISRLSILCSGVLIRDEEALKVLGYNEEVIPRKSPVEIELIDDEIEKNEESCFRFETEKHYIYVFKMEKVGYFFMISRFDYLGENFDMLMTIINRLAGSILFAIQYRQLNLAKRDAEEANRVKSDFMATMNHEIRTPLNAVVNASNLLKNTEMTEDQMELLKLINFSSDTVLSIINSSLEYTKLEREEVELENINFDLKESIDKITKMLSISYEYNKNKISINYDENLSDIIYCDYNLINQVLLNVIGNAYKFTNSGDISIKVDVEGERKINISVSDTGIGMDEKTIQSVFEIYNQGNTSIRRKFGGTGLGLAICRKIMPLLGGSIEVKSEVNKGSSFIISFEYGEVKTQNEIPEVESKKSFEELNIVVVEDNMVNAQLLKKVLEIKKMNVKVFELPLESYDYIVENYNNIDLVFMDISMPDIDGFTLTTKINDALKENSPKIIALTANLSNSHKAKANECKMVDFVGKPFQFEEIYKVIEKHTS